MTGLKNIMLIILIVLVAYMFAYGVDHVAYFGVNVSESDMASGSEMFEKFDFGEMDFVDGEEN